MINFLHTFSPNSILFTLGPINIYWYGLFIALGALCAIFITLKLTNYYQIKKDSIVDLSFWLIIGGVLGARIYHVLLEFPYYLNNFFDIFKIWQGGLAIHGGLISGFIIIWYFCRKNKINVWLLLSIITPGLALAQAIGRWGNYFNQELFGKPTNLPWGIPINIINRPVEYLNNEFFHPTFLYESLGNFLIFLILILIHVWLIKKQGRKNYYYLLSPIAYLILYSLLRFSMEFLRVDQAHIIFGLRLPQVVSLLIIIILAALLPKLKKHANILII